MGGTIAVESRVGEGSVFRFTVRLRRTDQIEPAAPATTIESPLRPDRVVRVLLAEDDTVNQLVALNMLRKMGCTVDIVGDGGAALAAAAIKDYDIILADALMPEVDGLQAIRLIRELPGPLGRVPIIAMTGRASTEDRELCLAAGADDFIAKPATPQQLAAAFAALLNREQPSSIHEQTDDALGDEADGEAIVPVDFGDAAPVLIAIFSAETEARLRRMAGLCEADDRVSLEREAHSLKSAAATFGCRRLSELAAALENDAMDVAIDFASAIEAMAVEFERARKRMVKELATLRPVVAPADETEAADTTYGEAVNQVWRLR
jgi:CheY-like chemotaxis protein